MQIKKFQACWMLMRAVLCDDWKKSAFHNCSTEQKGSDVVIHEEQLFLFDPTSCLCQWARPHWKQAD